MIIAIDFDGTCVTHEYPKIGRDIGAVKPLLNLIANGHQLILLTMRSGIYLKEAVLWFELNNIPLYAINDNPLQKIWTSSPKIHANLYIDDAALGIPLIKLNNEERCFVNWDEVTQILIKMGLI